MIYILMIAMKVLPELLMMQYSWPSMLGCHAWLLIIANISTDSSCNDMVTYSQDNC